MDKQHITAILAITSLAFSTGLMAQTMSKSEHKAADKAIEAEYKSARTSCDSFADNAKDICMAVAKGREKVAKAQLEARYKPSKEADYDVNVARAKADYSVAHEKCDDKAGNDKDVCNKEAEAALVRAKSDAKSQLKTAEAIRADNEKTIDAHLKAKEISEEARHDAATDKRDADYAVAKCDAMAGDARDLCVNKAKVLYKK